MARAVLALALLLSSASAPDPAAAPADPPLLDLARLYVATATGARLAPPVEALRGRRVRVDGYMVRMEDAPRGAFYLARAPVDAEEGGAGTGDLPPGALRVEVRRLAGEEIAWIEGPIEVTGTLETGRAEDDEGRVSWVRVVVDDAPAAAAPAGHEPPRLP